MDATFDLARLIGAHMPGHALAREFYTDPGIFERDMERILLRHWFCAAHASSVPRAGDYLLVDLGPESVIIVRALDGGIKALVNVCRHRGSRVCTARSGRASTGLLTCPYHAWSYDLTGRLVAARQMAESFDRANFGLKSLAVRVVGGLIFTTFADSPPDFAPAERILAEATRLHGWERAKVAHRETYAIDANWKLAVENYTECYHCQPAHPEYSQHHALARPAPQRASLETAGRARAAGLGIRIADVDEYAGGAQPGAEYGSLFRSALSEGSLSGALDGRGLAPLMGEFDAYDGNTTYFDVGPLSDFLGYSDHGVIYRFVPRSARRTEMEVIWLVHEDAREHEDYDVERLTSLWKVTSLQDKHIVEWNQSGVDSRFFVPGPYSAQESYSRRFVDWYLAELGQGLVQPA